MVPLKYFSSFFRSLELPLINTNLYIRLNCTKYSVISTVDEANSTIFRITKPELYVPIVTLKTEDNNKLDQLLLESESDVTTNPKTKDNKFKRTVYWNEYKSKIEEVIQPHNNNNFKRTLLDTSIPGLNRLFGMGFNDNNVGNPAGDPPVINNNANRVKRNSHRKYFLPRVDIKDYNGLIDGRNFYDQNISDDFKKYEELRKVMTDWKR